MLPACWPYPLAVCVSWWGRGGGICLLMGVCLPMALWECWSPCEQTDTCENITFPILRKRAVTNLLLSTLALKHRADVTWKGYLWPTKSTYFLQEWKNILLLFTICNLFLCILIGFKHNWHKGFIFFMLHIYDFNACNTDWKRFCTRRHCNSWVFVFCNSWRLFSILCWITVQGLQLKD